MDTVDLWKEAPAARSIKLLSIRIELAHHARRIVAKGREVVLRERARGRHDVACKADVARLFAGEKMRAHCILDIEAAIQKLVGLRIQEAVARPRDRIVIVPISSSSAMRRSISPITRFENGPRCMY